MKIVITCKDEDEIRHRRYSADCTDLCGSPPLGLGNSPEEAVGALFMSLIKLNYDYINRVDFTKLKIIKKNYE